MFKLCPQSGDFLAQLTILKALALVLCNLQPGAYGCRRRVGLLVEDDQKLRPVHRPAIGLAAYSFMTSSWETFRDMINDKLS